MQQPTGQVVYINSGGALQPAVIQGQPGLQQIQPQQQYVVISPPMAASSGSKFPTYKRNTSRFLGIMQIVAGVCLAGLNGGQASVYYNKWWFFATGWWAFPFYLIGGIFGIIAGSKPNKCCIITTMVMSLISCVTILCVITQAALSLTTNCHWYYYYDCFWESHVAVDSCFIIVGLAEFGFALAQSVNCCVAYSQKTNVQTSQLGGFINGGFVAYHANPQGAQMQGVPMQPVQNIQLMPQGAAGQNVAMVMQPNQPSEATAQPVTMVTGQNNTSNDASSPPKYVVL